MGRGIRTQLDPSERAGDDTQIWWDDGKLSGAGSCGQLNEGGPAGVFQSPRTTRQTTRQNLKRNTTCNFYQVTIALWCVMTPYPFPSQETFQSTQYLPCFRSMIGLYRDYGGIYKGRLAIYETGRSKSLWFGGGLAGEQQHNKNIGKSCMVPLF